MIYARAIKCRSGRRRRLVISVAPGLTCLGCSGDPAPVIVSVEGVVIASFVADSLGVRTATVFYTPDAYC